MYHIGFSGLGTWDADKELNRNVVHNPKWYSEEWWRRELRRKVVEKASNNKVYARSHRLLVLSAAQAQHPAQLARGTWDLDFGDGTKVSDYEHFYLNATYPCDGSSARPCDKGDPVGTVTATKVEYRTKPNTYAQFDGDFVPTLNYSAYQRLSQRIANGVIGYTLLDDAVKRQLGNAIVAYEQSPAGKAGVTPGLGAKVSIMAPPLKALVMAMPTRAASSATSSVAETRDATSTSSEGAASTDQGAAVLQTELTPEQQLALMMAMQPQPLPQPKKNWIPWAIGGAALAVGGGTAYYFLVYKKRKNAVAGW